MRLEHLQDIENYCLVSREDLLDEQQYWHESDSLKHFNFSFAPYFLVAPECSPVPIYDANDYYNYLECN